MGYHIAGVELTILRKAEQKLKAVKEIIDEWGRERDDGDIQYDWYYKDKYYALRKILEAKP